MVRLQRSVGDAVATVVGKLESLNPNSSVKDRCVTRHAPKHHYVLTVMGTETAASTRGSSCKRRKKEESCVKAEPDSLELSCCHGGAAGLERA